MPQILTMELSSFVGILTDMQNAITLIIEVIWVSIGTTVSF